MTGVLSFIKSMNTGKINKAHTVSHTIFLYLYGKEKIMRAESLRLGNFVIANRLYEGKVKRIEEIKEGYLFFEDSHAGEYDKDCEGVPIGQAPLVKSGFKYNEDKDVLSLKHFNFYFHADDSNQFSTVTVKLNGQIFSCMYIHELQNIFFVLTGQELPI